jgi:hypothetical protein
VSTVLRDLFLPTATGTVQVPDSTVTDTNSTVFVLHYWTLSTGPSIDGPSGRTAPGVDRQLLTVTGSS